MQNKNDIFLQLSPHLFWDVDLSKADIEKNKKWLIGRVLEYGLINDWAILIKHFGIKEIGEYAVTISDLDIRTISFISFLTGIPEKNFLCYTLNQSRPGHWNF